MAKPIVKFIEDWPSEITLKLDGQEVTFDADASDSEGNDIPFSAMPVEDIEYAKITAMQDCLELAIDIKKIANHYKMVDYYEYADEDGDYIWKVVFPIDQCETKFERSKIG